MIFIDRSQVPRPDWFGSADWGGRVKRLVIHLRDRGAQRRAADVIGPLPAKVVEAVWRLFEGRCAMCESTLDLEQADPAFHFADNPSVDAIKQFWPVESTNRHAYGGTALLWENLILLCPACDRARGDRFRVQFGQPVLRAPHSAEAGSRSYPSFPPGCGWCMHPSRNVSAPRPLPRL